MPRYHFDVQSGSGLVCQDFSGLDCPDDAAALAVARHGAGFTSHDECARNPVLTRYRFAVTDEAHRPLFEVPFTDLEPEPPPRRVKSRPARQ